MSNFVGTVPNSAQPQPQIHASLRLIIMHRMQKGWCFYCRGKTFLYSAGWRSAAREWLGISKKDRHSVRRLRWVAATVEHLARRADGGSNSNANVVMACAYCNSTRGTASVEDHQIAMRLLVELGEHPVAFPSEAERYAA